MGGVLVSVERCCGVVGVNEDPCEERAVRGAGSEACNEGSSALAPAGKPRLSSPVSKEPARGR